MECVLRVYGQAFDVNGFLVDSPWRPNPVYHRGEKQLSLRGFEVLEFSGFVLSVPGSDILGEAFADHASAVLKFLEENHSECERLKAFPGIEGRTLDFASPLREDQPMRSHHIPLELVRVAADLGIALEITVYVVSAEGQ
jgi:hypothetical protein